MIKIDITHLKTNSFGEQYFYEVNQSAFDSLGSKTTFDKTYRDTFQTEKMLYIVVGSDSGLLIKYLQNQYTSEGRKFVIYEKPEVIDYIEENIAYSKDFFLIVPPDYSLYQLEEFAPDHIIHARYQLVRSLSVIDSKSPVYSDLWGEIETNYNIFTTTESGNKITDIFINSNFQNLYALSTPFGHYPKLLEGTTAVIMGGGPTLDESIDWIKANQNKLVIFSAARISKRLYQEGIHTDLYVTVDPHDVSYDNSKGMLKYGKESTLVHTNYANNKLIANWEGARAYLGSRIPWYQPDQPDNLSVAGPTVTNTMLSVAMFMGCKQILFAGVDFCYSATGASHESSSLESKAGRYLDNAGGGQVETFSGRMAETTSSFANARNTMEQVVEHAKKTLDIEFYSLSAESAKIEGVLCHKTDKIILPSEDKTVAVQTLHQLFTPKHDEQKSYLKEVLKQAQDFRKLSSDGMKWSQEGLSAAKKLFDKTEQTNKLTQKIVKLKKQIQKNIGYNEEFYFQYSIESFADFMDPSIDPENQSQEEIKTSLIHYFEGLCHSIDPVLDSLDKTLETLKYRQKELEGTKHFTELSTFWKEREEYGRVNYWLKINHLTLEDLSEKERENYHELISMFDAEFEEQQSKLDHRLAQQAENLKTILDRVQIYFSDKRIEELKVISQYLSTLSSNRAQQLQTLAQGYYEELEGKVDEAMMTYTQLKDEELLLFGLKRMATLSLEKKDFETALNTLEVLINYSDEYFVSYADILAAIGDVQGAIQIYNHYLQTYDDDVATWIKITKALIQEKDLQNAQEGLKKISELDPNNPVIKKLSKYF